MTCVQPIRRTVIAAQMDDRPDPMPMMTGTLRENIARLAERERAETLRAPVSDRIADRITGFTGSMTFVIVHLALYGGWIIVNLGWVPAVPRFDPTFVVLAMTASVEAIFLSTFVLISQNRMAAAAQRRADLDLHISLLAEHELTRLATMVKQIADRLEVRVDERDYAEISRNVEPTDVLDALDAQKDENGGHEGPGQAAPDTNRSTASNA